MCPGVVCNKTILFISVTAVTAFYAECPAKQIYVTATIETKTKFTGLGVKVQNTGSCEQKLV